MTALYRNHMGDDLEVVNDAKISFANASKAESYETFDMPFTDDGYERTVTVPQLKPADQGLIRFLARGCRSSEWEDALDTLRAGANGMTQAQVEKLLLWAKRMPTHWTPFGQQVIKLRMKAPVPIRTQCFKSKIGFVENEESRRYIDSTPELFIPEFRERPEGSIKQGSGGGHPWAAHWLGKYTEQCQGAIDLYEAMIKDGIAPEQARFVLPQGVYVNWVWTGSLYAYAEFVNKRSDRSHAQHEVADIADAISEIIEPLFPYSWPALTR